MMRMTMMMMMMMMMRFIDQYSFVALAYTTKHCPDQASQAISSNCDTKGER